MGGDQTRDRYLKANHAIAEEMGILQRASGVLKDQNRIWIASLSRRTSLQNPHIEAAVVRATSHDESSVDYKNAQRVYAWVRLSPAAYLMPTLRAVSFRMDKTRNWAVALKGLMLMHGILCCQVPVVQSIESLPFDLSNFPDGHSNQRKKGAQNAFVRAYYAFLDHKSTFLFMNSQRKGTTEPSLMQEFVRLQESQGLLDKLFHIKPQDSEMIGSLIIEAMDCIVIEILNIHSIICKGIVRVLMGVYSAGKAEAAKALEVLQKATIHGEELDFYLKFCTEIGVTNASEWPKVELIPAKNLRELQHIIKEISEKSDTNQIVQEGKRLLVRGTQREEPWESTSALRTTVTYKWEMFDEDLKGVNEGSSSGGNPLASSPTLSPCHAYVKNELQKLNSFW